MDSEKITPVMEQYNSIKSQYPDCLIFFRLGDFYELFYEDAIYSSSVLNIVLTRRGRINNVEIPMCGVPAHSYGHYVRKLIISGKKVAICEQTETPQQAKEHKRPVVQRTVTKVITKSNLSYEIPDLSEENSFLLSLIIGEKTFHGVFFDINTDEFYSYKGSIKDLNIFLHKINPVEIVLLRDKKDQLPVEWNDLIQHTQNPSPLYYSQEKNLSSPLKTFMSHSEFTAACSLLFNYLLELKAHLPSQPPEEFFSERRMFISDSSVSKLNLVYHPLGAKHTLYGTINYCHTPMGKRFLRKMIISPLVNVEEINSRLSLVERILGEFVGKNKIFSWPALDLEKYFTRIMHNHCSLEEIYNFAQAMEQCVVLHEELSMLVPKAAEITDFPQKIFNQLGFEGNKCHWIINDGHPLSLLQEKKQEVLDSIEILQHNYLETTNISSLKIKRNEIAGMFIEIPLSQKSKIPQWFIHKQTLTNNIRYVTPELLILEKNLADLNHLVSIQEDLCKNTLISFIKSMEKDLKSMINFITYIDFLFCLANASFRLKFVKPTIDSSLNLIIKDGRHPVVEKNIRDFIENDTLLSSKRCAVITGPNMGGKSTYLKQQAHICILAQIGCFVPAREAHIGIVDGIYTRIGAEDDISSQKSTFMMEMYELKEIIDKATPRSLLLLDEIGRGTGTKDGIALGAATLEYVHDYIQCRCFFATNYCELSKVEKPCIFFLKTAYMLKGEDLILLHKIESGISEGSFGLHVAETAKLPWKLLDRAREIYQHSNVEININLGS